MEKKSKTDESFGEDMNRHIKNALSFFKSSKVALLLVLAFFIILIVLVIGKKDNVAVGITADEAEKKLAGIISQVKGIDKAEVMITYESTSKKVPATSQSNSTLNPLGESSESGQETTTKLYQNPGGQALILTELQPDIRGVVVVARGADDYMARLDIINAVTTVLNIPADKVEVLNMK